MPEIWQAVAEVTAIEALLTTTRDVPVYDDLMKFRLDTVGKHDIRMSTIIDIIDNLDPLPGAADFLDWAQQRFQVAILSDTFYEFAMPLMAKLEFPLLLCHKLEVDDDRIVGYRLRQDDPKRQSVRAFKSLNYTVVAAGDSFNDVSMLQEADSGYFFNAPVNVTAAHPDIEAVEGYQALQAVLGDSSSGRI